MWSTVKIYMGSWAVADDLTSQSGADRNRIGRSETRKSWEGASEHTHNSEQKARRCICLKLIPTRKYPPQERRSNWVNWMTHSGTSPWPSQCLCNGLMNRGAMGERLCMGQHRGLPFTKAKLLLLLNT